MSGEELLMRRREMMEKKADIYKKIPFTIVANEAGTLLIDLSVLKKKTSIKTKLNNNSWVTHTLDYDTTSDVSISLNQGDELSIIASGVWGKSGVFNNGDTITFSGHFSLKGNIMSLYSGDNYLRARTLTSYAFCDMFKSSTSPKIDDVSNLRLPARVLGSCCYFSLFRNCTYITSTPDLSATTLATNCYQRMFEGCSNLVTIPEILPAKTVPGAAYHSMFAQCPKITRTPIMPATSYQYQSCYAMFQNCTSLVTASELPATTINVNTYNAMFYKCTSLVTGPTILPAMKMYNQCYGTMFEYCAKLTNAPILPATTLTSNCYQLMFHGCSKINYIKAMFLSTNNAAYNWVSGVAATGTFVKNANAATIPTGASGIPSRWTVETATE